MRSIWERVWEVAGTESVQSFEYLVQGMVVVWNLLGLICEQ